MQAPKVELKTVSVKTSTQSPASNTIKESVILRKVSDTHSNSVTKKPQEKVFDVSLRKVIPEVTVTSPDRPSRAREGANKQTPAAARARFKEMDDAMFNQTCLDSGNSALDASKRRSPSPNSIRDQMLLWCQYRLEYYENVEVTDFSTSWSDGLAFCALVHSYFPEAFDYDTLDPKNRRENFQLAFETAEKYGGVYSLLEVDDMVSTLNPDWKSVFTYVNSLANELREAAKKKKEEKENIAK